MLGLMTYMLPGLAIESDAASLGAQAGSIRDVNPTGDTNNCVNCAIATDATLAGRPASALPGEVTQISELEKTFGGHFKPIASPSAAAAQLKRAGNGARAIVFGARGPNEAGHVFNAVNQNGTVRFLDGQTGSAAS